MLMACPFCSPPAAAVIYQGEYVYGMRDGYPVTKGHTLLIPHRHIASWFEATTEEQRELMQAVASMREL